jgi:hypothetical protein
MPNVIKTSVFLSCVLGAACGGSPSFEPVYEACATDENWVSFDDYEKTGRAVSTGTNLPQWNAPQMGAMVSAASGPVFQWQPSATTAGSPNGDATCPQYQPASLPGLQIKHLPPVSGTVYDVQFAVDGAVVYRVVTSRQRLAVPASTLSTWNGKTVTVTLYAAKMLVNEIAEGPYQAAPLQIKVTP